MSTVVCRITGLFFPMSSTGFLRRIPRAFGIGCLSGRDGLMGVRRSGSNQPSESFRGEFVSGNYFSTFGILPMQAGCFRPRRTNKRASVAAVMSFRTWQEKFGKDPSVVGSGVFHQLPACNHYRYCASRDSLATRYGAIHLAFWIPTAAEPVIEPSDSLLNEPLWNWLNLIGRPAGADQAPGSADASRAAAVFDDARARWKSRN